MIKVVPLSFFSVETLDNMCTGKSQVGLLLMIISVID